MGERRLLARPPAALAWAAALVATAAVGLAEPDATQRFRRAPGSEPLSEPDWTPEQRAEIERLHAIGYVEGSLPAPSRSGVTVHVAERVARGTNFYTSGHEAGAVLADMQGRVLHTWSLDFGAAFPDGIRGRKRPPNSGYWRRAHPFANGDVLAIFEGLGLVKLDRRSQLLWAVANNAHHDLDVGDDGTIVVLTREAVLLPRFDANRPVLEDFVAFLDPNGRELRRISLLEAFERSPEHAPLLRRRPGKDVLHTNTVEILDGRQASKQKAFRKGNLLLSSRHQSVIMVLDPRTESIVWARTGPWRAQHDPTELANGHILLFDNQGRGAAPTSAVLEIEPTSGEVVWRYDESPGRPFFSFSCGANARLPNDNTLVTESDPGRAFEVTPEGRIVWEFVSPHRAGENRELVATLFEVVRLPPDFGAAWRGASEESRR